MTFILDLKNIFNLKVIQTTNLQSAFFKILGYVDVTVVYSTSTC
jgi:hypothetical protein